MKRSLLLGILFLVVVAEVSWMNLQMMSMRTTGHYLASRVAAINK